MNIISKVIDLIHVLITTKQSIFSVFKNGFSIASSYIVHSLYNIDHNISTVIDVGANKGQYALASKHFYPEAIVHSFEPVPACFEKLKLNTRNISNLNIYNMALGSTEAKIKFYQNAYSHASSALPISNYQKENVPETRNTKEIDVMVTTLDNFIFSTPLSSPILLKMDVQGYEMEVLKGGKKFISQVDYILLETSFTPMYENEPLFDDLHTYLKSEGFELLAPLDFLRKNDKILQMDVLYKKKR